MNNRDELMKELVATVNNGKLLEVSDKKLEEYFSAIIAFGSTSGEYFTPFQYPQVCEALRLLLLKRYTEKTDRKNTFLQAVVIILTIVTVTTASLQIYLMRQPNQQLQEQVQLLKEIHSQLPKSQKENQHQQTTSLKTKELKKK